MREELKMVECFVELDENEQNDKTTISKRDYLFLYDEMGWGKDKKK